jgi:alpha-beta hydrolase superfamily lysophospholipase
MPALHHEGRFAAPDGTDLFYQAWLPAGKPRGVLVNLHGLGDHSGLYPGLAQHFPPRGIALYAFDLRGNGRSAGQRGYVRSWDCYRQPGKALFLLGNSLGGLIVLDYALRDSRGLAGVIAAAPPLGKLGVPPILMALGRMLSRVVPRFSLQVGMDLTGLARDPAVVEAVLADRLFHRRGTARLSTEVVTTIARVQSHAAELAVPLLLLHGSADRMVPPDGSREFFRKVQHPDRKFLEYPEGYHGLFADVEAERVLNDVSEWLDGRVPIGR